MFNVFLLLCSVRSLLASACTTCQMSRAQIGQRKLMGRVMQCLERVLKTSGTATECCCYWYPVFCPLWEVWVVRICLKEGCCDPKEWCCGPNCPEPAA